MAEPPSSGSRGRDPNPSLVPLGSGITRRDLLKATGVLVVGFSLFGTRSDPGRAAKSVVASDVLDSWLSVGSDGRVTLFTGKVDLGTGVRTAMAQIAAEELDIAVANIDVVMGDTALTVDQGPTLGSRSIALGGPQVRQAAAEARQALLQLAVARLGAPVEQLTVTDGVVVVVADQTHRISYGGLIGGQRFQIDVSGTVMPKPPESYAVVGQSVPRVDLPSKVTGQAVFVHDIRRPGMLHGRVVRPAGIGSMLVEVDEQSVRDVPGARVVVRGNFIGVVAEREEDAVRAARQLRVTWSDWSGLPAMEESVDMLRRTPSVERVLRQAGDVDADLAAAERTVEATYYFPFQGHASIGPSCAVAEVRDGQAIVWSGTQRSHELRDDLADVLHVAADRVRVIWVQGSGSYGLNGADDASIDAAILSQAVGRPVRLQWTREDEHRWSPVGPALVMDLRAGLDDDGQVVAFDFQTYSPSHFYRDILAVQLLNREPTVPLGPPSQREPWGGDLGRIYTFDGSVRDVVHQLQRTQFRSRGLRAPGQVATTFGLESFMDELATAAAMDPVAFRLRHRPRAGTVEVLRAAARHANWDAHVVLGRAGSPGDISTGRGVAVVQRGSTFVAMVAEVAVHRKSGHVQVTRVVVAHDCGLIINPDGVRNQIEGSVIQTLSRTLHEELSWDGSNFTSTNWSTYPILTFAEVPDIEIVLLDHVDRPAAGVGEPASCPVAAAVANAIFDATGVRLREVPFTPARVLAALEAQS